MCKSCTTDWDRDRIMSARGTACGPTVAVTGQCRTKESQLTVQSVTFTSGLLLCCALQCIFDSTSRTNVTKSGPGKHPECLPQTKVARPVQCMWHCAQRNLCRVCWLMIYIVTL